MADGDAGLPARSDHAGSAAVSRIGDNEAAAILKRAARTSVLGHLPSAHDLTLADLMEVAREVDLDPQDVRRAAAVRPRAESGTQRLLFGGQTLRSVRAHTSVPLPAHPTALAQTCETFLARPGRELKSDDDSWAWETLGTVGHMRVTARQKDGGTEITADANRASVLAMAYFPTLMAVGALSGALGLFASVAAAAGPLVALAGLLGIPLLLARPIFRRLDDLAADRTEQLAMELLRTLESAAEGTEER